MSISTKHGKVENVAYNFSDAQVKVREATSNDPWGPSTALMSEIADLTHNPVAFTEIMSIVWKRLNDSGKNWRHVYKSLVLLDSLIICGHEKVAQQCRENVFTIEKLKDFQHVEDSRDQGLNIRKKAHQITSLLLDDERLINERTLFILTRNKFKQNNPDPVGAESRRSNRHHISDSALEPEYKESRPSTATEEEMQLQIALALSREECKKADEMRKSDDARLQMTLEESQKQVDRRATSTSSQPSALNSDPFAAWKNPVASVPSVSLISSNSINLLGGYDECSNEIERLALSLNNNCAEAPSIDKILMMSSKAKAVVKFTYEPRLEDELGLTKGEHVNVIDKNSDGWWKGEAPNGSVGWFPSNYVEMLNNSTPPKTLSDMPVDVVGLIIERSDYKEQLILRKTSKSLRTLVDKLKPACKRLEVFCWSDCIFCAYDDHRFAYVPSTCDHEQFAREWSDYREGKIKIILKTDYEKVAFDDLAYTLKNQKLQLETFSFDSLCDGDCCKYRPNEEIYNKHGRMENILRSINHQLSVKKCSVCLLSFHSDISILSHMKPGVLEKITILFHNDDKWSGHSEVMEQVALLEQWKQAKELEVDTSLDENFPVKHATHFKRLHFEPESLYPEPLVLIRNLVSKHENIEFCTILTDGDPLSLFEEEEVNVLMGTLVSPNLYHYTIPDSKGYLEFVIKDNLLTIEKKKKKSI